MQATQGQGGTGRSGGESAWAGRRPLCPAAGAQQPGGGGGGWGSLPEREGYLRLTFNWLIFFP